MLGRVPRARRTLATLFMPHTPCIWLIMHEQNADALPLEAMYAAGLFQQRADSVHRLLAQQVRAERVSGGLR